MFSHVRSGVNPNHVRGEQEIKPEANGVSEEPKTEPEVLFRNLNDIYSADIHAKPMNLICIFSIVIFIEQRVELEKVELRHLTVCKSKEHTH